MKRVSTRTRNKIVAAHRAGATPAELQKKYKVSASSIRRWTKAPVPNPPKPKKRRSSATTVSRIDKIVNAIIDNLRGPLAAGIREGIAIGVEDHVDRIMVAFRARVTEVA